MPRGLSDKTIEQRVRLVYQRAQALARNSEYCRDIARMRSGYELDGSPVRGLRFDHLGFLDDAPLAQTLVLVDEVCRRSGLTLPVLPERLRALSLEDLRAWDDQLFDDLPGWKIEPKDPKQFREAARAGRALPANAFRHVPVPLRRLQQRHRGVDDTYAICWRVFDLRLGKKKDVEIARLLWPEAVDVSPETARQRVYDYLCMAKKMITAAYSPVGPQKERRRRRQTPSRR